MPNKYDLDTFEGRISFDAMVEQYIRMDQDIAGYDADIYAQEVWDNLEFTTDIEHADEIDFINDIDEAKARVFSVVKTVLKNEQEWRAETEAENAELDFVHLKGVCKA